MPETHGERTHTPRGGPAEGPADAGTAPRPPALTASVRRHLGLTLRSVYPADPAEPMGERIDAALVRLDGP